MDIDAPHRRPIGKHQRRVMTEPPGVPARQDLGDTPGDELAKLQQLKDSGAISQAEYESLKAKTIAAS